MNRFASFAVTGVLSLLALAGRAGAGEVPSLGRPGKVLFEDDF